MEISKTKCEEEFTLFGEDVTPFEARSRLIDSFFAEYS